MKNELLKNDSGHPIVPVDKHDGTRIEDADRITKKMRDALKHVKSKFPRAHEILSLYIGCGDHEEFELRGIPAIEIRCGGKVPKEVKKVIPVILGRETIKPDNKRSSGIIVNCSLKKYRASVIETKTIKCFFDNNGIEKTVKGLKMSRMSVHEIVNNRKILFNYSQKKKIEAFVSRLKECEHVVMA